MNPATAALKPVVFGSLQRLLRFLPIYIIVGSILNDAFFQNSHRWAYHLSILAIAIVFEMTRIAASITGGAAGGGRGADNIRNSLFFGDAMKNVGDDTISAFFNTQQVNPVLLMTGFFLGYAVTSLAQLQTASSADPNIPTDNIGSAVFRGVVIGLISILVAVVHQQAFSAEFTPMSRLLVILGNTLAGAAIGGFFSWIQAKDEKYNFLMFQDNTNTAINRPCTVLDG